MEEIWRDIIGFEGLYQVSNLGRVKSLKRIALIGKHKAKLIIPEKIKSFQINDRKNGLYVKTDLNKNGKSKSIKIHRLVAIAFIANPENKPEVNHKNGIHDDNRVENLEWVTTSENRQHSFDHLHRKNPEGFDNRLSKQCSQYSLSGKLIETFGSRWQAYRKTGVHPSTIIKAIRGEYSQAGGFVWR